MTENFLFGIGSNLTIPCDSHQGNDDDCSLIVIPNCLCKIMYIQYYFEQVLSTIVLYYAAF